MAEAISHDGAALRHVDDVRAWLGENVYAPKVGDDTVGRVGLEAEMLPFWLAKGGRPAARLALVEIVAIVDGIDGAERVSDLRDPRPKWRLDGTIITEEPGAQVEVAGPPERNTAAAIVRLERVIDRLGAAFDAAGAGLAAAGLDVWSQPDEVPVQIEIPRYDAMTTYFRRRGERYGHLLMCSSCSLQVNVDLGPPEVAWRRWLLANLVSPVITAAFASSPTDDAVNGRAVGWRRLDPTRTGVPPPLVGGGDEPLEHALADAMRADVLLVSRDDGTHAGTPGWSFGDWVAEPHPTFGPPTTADLADHLTTLFPEARLRRYLEIRGLDALPRRWRAIGVSSIVGLLYDERATDAAVDLLEPHRADLPDLLRRAAHDALGDPLLADLSLEVLTLARDGAERLGDPHAAAIDSYLETYVEARRHPSDELRALLAEGPAAAFAWAETRA